jgi:peptide/nickel transport system substrate-binding protein
MQHSLCGCLKGLELKRILCALALLAALVTSACTVGPGGQEGQRTLVIAIGEKPQTLNRYLSSAPGVKAVLAGNIYESLVQINAQFEPVPWLAESWKVSEDGLRYSFDLRKNVTWQDGERFTSEDVAFTVNKMMPLSQLTAFSRLISSVETPDETTVIVSFSQPYAPFLKALASAAIMPKHIFTSGDPATDPANMKPVGTGPYKLDSMRDGDQLVFSKFEGYWGKHGDVDRLVYKVMPDSNARQLAMQSDEVGFVSANYVDQQMLDQLGDRFQTRPVLGGKAAYTGWFNTSNPQLSSPAVRHAIYQAIDRQAIVDKATYGKADVARGPIPKEFSSLITGKVDFNKEFPYDPAAAAAALDQAGFKPNANGERFALTLIYQSIYSIDQNMAALMKANLADIGVTVTLTGLDPQVFAERLYKKGEFDLAVQGFTSYEDPSIGISRLYLCNPQGVPFRNPTKYCDATVDDSFQQASMALDSSERAKSFETAERRIQADLPSMPLVVLMQSDIYNSSQWDADDATAVYPMAYGLIKAK